MFSLDKLDRKILYELDHNSRISVSRLAKKMRQSRDRVGYRIDRLVERKIISKFTTSVNLYRLGFCIYKTYLRLENDKVRVGEFVEYLKAHPRVYWVALADGNWDLLLAVFARNGKEFHTIYTEMLSRFDKIVLDFSMYTMVDMWKYPKNYLVGRKSKFVSVGGKPENNTIDQIDYEVLKLLSEDSRTPVTIIADLVETTPAVVRYRIEQLERRGIITGYPIDLDLRRLGMLFLKAQIYLRSHKTKLSSRFIEYCAENPHITYCISQLGDCTLEVEMEVYDYAQYNTLVDQMRGEFPKLIRNIHSVLIRKFDFHWVPRNLDLSDPQA